ncbi:hypothetical protein ACFQ4O_10755 [Methylopila musalis]|uniref:DUF680 domain-containing protein n=1 Tax=Methylopila musalis TaxID=1134781 RepID=A0ABW3Z9N4_9HYPH
MKTLTAALLALGLAATFAAPASAEPCARKTNSASTQTEAPTGT